MIFYFGLRDAFLPTLNVEESFGLFRKPPYLLQKDLSSAMAVYDEVPEKANEAIDKIKSLFSK